MGDLARVGGGIDPGAQAIIGGLLQVWAGGVGRFALGPFTIGPFTIGRFTIGRPGIGDGSAG